MGRLKDYRYFWIALILLSAGLGCARKSVERGTADDVIYARLCGNTEGGCLLIHETIFQASSKRSEGGATTIYGYDESRISIYDIQTGQLVARKPFGKRKQRGTTVLGVHKGLAWIYSLNSALGLHARDLRSLDVKVSQEQIFKKNQQLLRNLAQPEWHRISDFYGFDDIKGKLIVTDTQGHHYLIDPQDYQTTRVSDSFRIPTEYSRGFFETSIPYRGKILSLSGTLRKTLQLHGKPLAPELSFLDGKLLADSKHLSVEDRFSVRNRLFEPAKGCFIVAHRSSINKDGRLVISLLRLKGGSRATEVWQTTLSDLFFDINKARETDAFKIVFSKGNPSFDFKFLDIMDNKLVLIYMLHVHCLDLETGRILWKHRL